VWQEWRPLVGETISGAASISRRILLAYGGFTPFSCAKSSIVACLTLSSI
jgi:hypothetical protein